MMPKDVRVDGTFWQSIFFVVPFLIPVTIFYAHLRRFHAKNPGKISFQFSFEKMLFFSFHFA